MPNKSFKAENAAVAISDPGEQLREEHFFLDRLVVKVANIIAWTFPIDLA